MGHRELRERELARQWLSAGLCLMRLTRPVDEELRHVAPWILATVAELQALPPPGVVADVGRLFGGRSLQLVAANTPTEPALRRALRRYEDHFLGRLVQERRFTMAVDAVVRLDSRHRPAGVGLLLASVLERIQYRWSVSINQGLIRNLTRRRGAEIRAEGFEALTTGSETVALLTEGYSGLADAAEEAPTLLGDSDVFAIENLDVLGDLSQRVAISQAIEAAEWLGQMLTPVVGTRRHVEGTVPTELEDESTYPTGGFASVSTSGSGTMENLVISELMYMEQPHGDTLQREVVDLFDVRYAEGELLHYTRDESFVVRRRRQVVFIIDESLARARLKDPDLPWQRMIIVLGLIVTTARQLEGRLGDEELLCRVVFCVNSTGRRAPSLDPERRLCELILREWQERGMADVDVGTLAEVSERLSDEVRRSVVQVIICAVGDRRDAWRAASPDPEIWVANLDVSRAVPSLAISYSASSANTIQHDGEPLHPAAAWGKVAMNLLEQLM